MEKETVLRLYFKIGDLVQYVSYYGDIAGGWLSKGDFGIVVGVVDLEDGHQIVKVRWFSDGHPTDMASSCLSKVTLSGSSVTILEKEER